MSTISTLVAAIPAPPGNGISIGGLNLRLYGLMIALGVIAAVWLFGKMLERRGVGDADDASAIAMWGVGAGIVGSRLYHVVTDWHRFRDNLGDIPKIWEGGLGIPGGLLFGVAAGLWQARKRGIPALVGLTCAAPAIPLAQAIGRWGNYFNQELFGGPTDLPWALTVDPAHVPAAYAVDTTFHPTFLYESLWNFALAALLVYIDRRWNPQPGRLFALYLIGYGTGRLWIEMLRIDPATTIGPFRVNELVASAAIIGGLGWWFASRNQSTTWAIVDSEHDDATSLDTVDDRESEALVERDGGVGDIDAEADPLESVEQGDEEP